MDSLDNTRFDVRPGEFNIGDLVEVYVPAIRPIDKDKGLEGIRGIALYHNDTSGTQGIYIRTVADPRLDSLDPYHQKHSIGSALWFPRQYLIKVVK